MERFEVLENIFLLFVGSSATNGNSTARSFFDEFLGLALGTDDFADIVGF